MLTPIQLKTLRFIIGRIDASGGISPTITECAAHLGLKSKSGVCRVLDGLEDRGWIRRRVHHARSITVLKRPPAPKAIHEIAQDILHSLSLSDNSEGLEVLLGWPGPRRLFIGGHPTGRVHERLTGAHLRALCEAVTGASTS